MNALTITQLALSRIWATRARSILTMLGVIIGVASLVALTSVAAGATSGITASLSSLGANTISVSTSAPTALTQDDVAALGELPNVNAVSYTVGGSGTAAVGSTSAKVSLTGVSDTYTTITNPAIAIGRFLPTFPGSDAVRSAVLSSATASTLAVTATDVDKQMTINGLPFTLVGILDDATTSRGTGSIYMSANSARSVFAQFPYVTSATIQANDAANVNGVLASADSLLRHRYGLTGDSVAPFTLANQASLLTSLASIQSLLSVLLGGIASISLIVGGIGIMNIMLVSVRERTREIGVRRAIGARQGQVLTQFLIEAVVLSLVGGLIGLGVGIGVSALIAQVAGWPFAVQPSTLAIALGFSAGVGIVFGVWPARAAARLQPVDALRFE